MHTCEAASKNKRSEARKRRNRQHAKNSRERRRQRVAWLETRLSVLEEDKAELLRQEAALVAENAALVAADTERAQGRGVRAGSGSGDQEVCIGDATGVLQSREDWLECGQVETWAGARNEADSEVPTVPGAHCEAMLFFAE